jgi:hypothetical protein
MRRPRVASPPLALVALGVLALGPLVACTGGTDNAKPTTTTSSPSSTSSSTTSTSAPRSRCGALAAPSGATQSMTELADVDGDGSDDELTTYVAAGSWHLRVDRAVELSLGTVGAESKRIIGGADVDADGKDEIWVQTGSGASSAILGLFRYRDCTITSVTLGGAPAELAVGASVANTSGVECTASRVRTLAGSSDDGVTYAVTETSYALEGDELTSRGAKTATVTSDDPEFARISSFHCGDLAM